MARIIAKEAAQCLDFYILRHWQKKQQAAFSRVNVDAEAADLGWAARRAQSVASELGGWLMTKQNDLKMLDGFLNMKKNHAFDVDIVASDTATIWMADKESPEEALKFEHEALSAELSIIAPTIEAFVAAAIVFKNDASMAAVVSA